MVGALNLIRIVNRHVRVTHLEHAPNVCIFVSPASPCCQDLLAHLFHVRACERLRNNSDLDHANHCRLHFAHDVLNSVSKDFQVFLGRLFGVVSRVFPVDVDEHYVRAHYRAL